MEVDILTPKSVIETNPKIQLEVDLNEVIRYLGDPNGKLKLSPYIKATLEKASQRGKEMAQPKFVYQIVPRNSLAISSQCIQQLLSYAEYIGVVVCTIGDLVESQVADFFARKEYLKGVILDSVGSVLVESLANSLEQILRAECAKFQYKLSIRYSPGYGDWNLTGQKELFQLLETSQIGVYLNASCLMHPLKSISFICAIGKNIPSIYEHHRKCEFCKKLNCKFRN